MIELKNITKVYNLKKRNQFTALHEISLTIDDGDFVAIIGESGSGKSTLLHIIGLLDYFTTGEYKLNGRNINGEREGVLAKLRASEIGFVKQDFALIDNYTVLDNVMLPLYPIKASDKRKKALGAIEKLGIKALAEKDVSQLSGGEKQRVAIARAIVTQPKMLLADEPTGSLDSKTGDEIFEIFREFNTSGITVIIVTHDNRLAAQCNRQIAIKDGKLI